MQQLLSKEPDNIYMLRLSLLCLSSVWCRVGGMQWLYRKCFNWKELPAAPGYSADDRADIVSVQILYIGFSVASAVNKMKELREALCERCGVCGR